MSAMTLRGAAVLWLGALGTFGCTTTLGGDVSATPTATTAAKPAESPAPTQKERLEAAHTGPKKRIAVAKFDAIGAFIAQYGGYDLGGGLAAQLATELVKTGRFIVVERIALAGVLREQELAATKLVSRETAAQLGQVLGAQLLVRGSVTEFEAKAGGGGLRLGGRDWRGLGGGSVQRDRHFTSPFFIRRKRNTPPSCVCSTSGLPVVLLQAAKSLTDPASVASTSTTSPGPSSFMACAVRTMGMGQAKPFRSSVRVIVKVVTRSSLIRRVPEGRSPSKRG